MEAVRTARREVRPTAFGQNGGMSNYLASAAVGVLAALALGGCSTGSEPDDRAPTPHPAPVNGGKCNDLVGLRGQGGTPTGFDWSGEKHKFTDTVTLFVCAAPTMTGITLSLSPLPTGVSVDPAERTVPFNQTSTGGGVFPFRVHVRPGARGALRATVVDDDPTRPYTMADLVGPKIVTDADGWRLTRG